MRVAVVNNLTFKMGGEAGQGVESSGAGFAKALARSGVYVYGLQDYMSRIRGGHNFYEIRISDRDVQATETTVHVLLPLDAMTVNEHVHEVVPGGAVIMDAPLKVDDGQMTDRGVIPIRMPLSQIAEREGAEKGLKREVAKLMVNTASIGVAASITDLPFEFIEQIIVENFGGKK